jgi:hypothetical protein
MSSPAGPNPITAAWSMLMARRVRRPRPKGDSGHVPLDNSTLSEVLEDLRRGGVSVLADHRGTLAAYRDQLAAIDPDALTRDGALAYWINLYNAGALELAAHASTRSHTTVLRVPGGFRRTWAHVAGENLSLDAIEHGKIRRFKDPRIHGGLVCGSASCPTLRYEPFTAEELDEQLDGQMRSFLAGGGAVQDEAGSRLHLSRVFLWFGGDFTRPSLMPTLLPARKAAVADALGTWLSPEIDNWRLTTGPTVTFQQYDWSLACAIGTSDRQRPTPRRVDE